MAPRSRSFRLGKWHILGVAPEGPGGVGFMRSCERLAADGRKHNNSPRAYLDLAAQTEVDQSVFHSLLADLEAVG